MKKPITWVQEVHGTTGMLYFLFERECKATIMEREDGVRFLNWRLNLISLMRMMQLIPDKDESH
jgi:hypothetical protein